MNFFKLLKNTFIFAHEDFNLKLFNSSSFDFLKLQFFNHA